MICGALVFGVMMSDLTSMMTHVSQLGYFSLFLVPIQFLHYLYKNYCSAIIIDYIVTINPVANHMNIQLLRKK